MKRNGEADVADLQRPSTRVHSVFTVDEQVFFGWKEIASYFGKGVRTVQRWEINFALPVVRPLGEQNSVFAFRAELDKWLGRNQRSLEHDCQYKREVLLLRDEITRLRGQIALLQPNRK